MSRPSKFSKEIEDKFVNFISDGFSIRLACKGCDVSEDSVSRWRKKYPNFNKKIVEASDCSWKDSKSLAKYGKTPYKRFQRAYTPILSSHHHSSITTKLSFPKVFNLPIRKEYPPDMRKTDPYFNQSTRKVEWIDTNGVFHVCPVEKYYNLIRRKNDSPFIIV